MTRPKWYDDELLASSKMLRKKIASYKSIKDKEAFFQDVMVYACQHWKEYSKNHPFSSWAYLCFRNVLMEHGRISKTKKRSSVTVEIQDGDITTGPIQDKALELSQVVDLIPKTRNGLIFLSSIRNESNKETAKEFGLTGARVGVIVQKERAKLIERMEKTKNVAVEGLSAKGG